MLGSIKENAGLCIGKSSACHASCFRLQHTPPGSRSRPRARPRCILHAIRSDRARLACQSGGVARLEKMECGPKDISRALGPAQLAREMPPNPVKTRSQLTPFDAGGWVGL